MYEKGTSIGMTSNASFVPQNLSLLVGPKGIITFAVISRNCVNVVSTFIQLNCIIKLFK